MLVSCKNNGFARLLFPDIVKVLVNVQTLDLHVPFKTPGNPADLFCPPYFFSYTFSPFK